MIRPVHLVFVGALGVGAYLLTHKNPKVAPMQFVSTPDKRAMMALITSIFAVRGFHPNVGKAAVINAIAESNLDPAAVGDNGHSVGLFQISDLNGRRDLSGYDRTDPADNVRWIINNEGQGLTRINEMAKAGAGVPELAAAFCTIVERPANSAKRAKERADLARTVYPA